MPESIIREIRITGNIWEEWMVAVPEMNTHDMPGRDETGTAPLIFQRLTILFGIGAVFTSILGLASIHWNLGIYRFFYPGYKTIAFSAAIIWILFGLILAFQVRKPFRGGIRACILAVISVIAVFALIEFPLQLLGQQFIVETWLYHFGNAILAHPTTPISPVAAGLIIPLSLALFLLVYGFDSWEKVREARNAVGIIGLVVFLVGFTLILSYIYGMPFLYETQLLPIAPDSSIALFLIGAGLITAAGPEAFPLKYFQGNSTKSQLLRTFVPLVIILIFVESFLQVTISSLYPLNTAIMIALFLVTVTIITTYVVGRASRSLGNAIDRAEQKRRTAESLRAAAEERYRELFENVSIGILRSTPGPHGKIIEANPAALKIFEADNREQLFAIHPSDLYLDADQRRIISDEIVTKGGINGLEVRYKTLKGKPIWGRITATKKTSETGETYFDNTIEDITERKRAEEALKESEIRFRTILDQASDAIIIHNIHGQIINVNQKACQNLGYTRDELLSMSILDIDPEAIKSGKDQIWQKAILGQDVSFESHEKRKDGSTFPVEITLGQIKLENETLIIGIVRDITERKKAEEEQRETKEYLEHLIRYANAPIIVWNPQFRITEFNHAFETLTGLTRDQVIGRHLHLLFPKESCNSSMDQIRRTLSGEQWEVVEIPIRHISGRKRLVLWNSANIGTSQGTIIATIAQGQDITERVEAEETIRSAKAFLDMVVDMSPFSMWICDKEGTVTRVNRSLCKTINLTPDAIVGKYNVLADVNLENAGVMPDIRAVFEKHIPARFAIPWKAADAGEVDFQGARDMYIDVSIFPILDAHGELTNAVCQWIDITERKQAELQRELLISELEQKNAELERFTYTVSHDLKSPVITIRGFLGLLADDAKKGDTVQMESDIRRIFSATDKMQTLLEDLLTLSRIGRIVNPPETINFGTIAEEAVEQLTGNIRQHGITVTIAPDLPEVYVDHTRIREVLVNLIENAIKFRGDQPSPTIEIGMRCEENGQVFFVKDNGIGIEEQYAKIIFGLFEKLDAKTDGTGVGLAIVKRIIEVHGGKIWVESPGPGLGSTFCFTLPVTGSKCIYTPEKG